MSAENGPKRTDVAVIGAGPGGYVAAFAAADKGLKVTLIDADPQPGGVCLNRGCIPSKALLHVARLINESREAEAWGVRFAPPEIDIDALRQWKNSVVGKNSGGIRQLAKARGVELIQAWARFENSQTLLLSSERDGEADQGRLEFQNAIIAVGSRPTVIPALNIDSPRVMNSTDALELPDVPESLLIIGGGYIGLEMGTAYAALGSAVSVVEMTDGLLPGADRDLVRILHNRLKNTFKAIHLSTKVVSLEDAGESVKVVLRDHDGQESTQSFARVLVSVGRTPNSDVVGLDKTRVRVIERGFVAVDPQRRTDDPHIYAIGDIAGEPMLAHKASYEGKVAVEAIAGEPAMFDARAVPAVVFTDPEIAWAGLTETQATAADMPFEVAKFPWGASGRATAMGRNDGLTKMIVSPENKAILGVGIVGIGAGELIAEAVLAIEMGAIAQDVAMSIHAHPTLSETVGECAEQAFGTSPHLFRPRR
ncbi:MAG: dihydrolipoyl dehydrogenase [Phycisphaerales bacterium]|nr:dihydrolipoyl dehydrogenase [Phycisphaerales bacterium]